MTDYTRLISGLVPKLDGESAVRHRSAVVDTVNADGTVDLDFNGTIVPDVSVLDGARVQAGTTVQVFAWAGDLLVLGVAGNGAGAVQAESATTASTTSTTYEYGTPAFGVPFVAPASGMVWVTLAAQFSIALTTNNGRSGLYSFDIREGATPGAGTSILPGDDSRALQIGINGSLTAALAASTRYLASGLTPGAVYNSGVVRRVSGTSVTLNQAHRRIMVEPA